MNNKRKDKGKVCVLVVMGDHHPSRPGDFTNYITSGKDAGDGDCSRGLITLTHKYYVLS